MNPRPPAQQTGALPTELTRRRFLLISALLSSLSSLSPRQNTRSFTLSLTAEMPTSLNSLWDIMAIAALSACLHLEIIVCQSLSNIYFVIIILFHFLNLLPAYYCLVKIFLPACNFYSFLAFLTYCKAQSILCHEKVRYISFNCN